MAARGTAIRIAISLYARADEVGGTGFGKDDFRAWAVLLEVFRNSMEGPSSSYGATLERVNKTLDGNHSYKIGK